MFLKLLRVLASLDVADLKKAQALLTMIMDYFGAALPQPGTTGALENVQMSEEETALVEQISQKLSADGTQAAFDGSRLRGLAKFLQDSGLGEALLSILLKRAGALT
jgi:hypothetical protein